MFPESGPVFKWHRTAWATGKQYNVTIHFSISGGFDLMEKSVFKNQYNTFHMEVFPIKRERELIKYNTIVTFPS